MAGSTLEDRIDDLETKFSKRIDELGAQVSRLSAQVSTPTPSGEGAWWKNIVGVYKDDPEFDEAMRLGREYRESLRPREDKSPR